jgi:hypothetical protein
MKINEFHQKLGMLSHIGSDELKCIFLKMIVYLHIFFKVAFFTIILYVKQFRNYGQLKGLSGEISGGSKVLSMDRSPFKLPTLCS